MAGFCSAHKHYEEGCNTCQAAKELNEAMCIECGMEPCNCGSIEQAGSNSVFGGGLCKTKEIDLKIVPINVQPNADAIKMLEEALKKVKEGEITTIGLAWTTKDGSISGDVSAGKDNLRMWAALEHVARNFYAEIILAED